MMSGLLKPMRPEMEPGMAVTGTIVSPKERILVTGATGFLGGRVVESLLEHGYHNLRCFTRCRSKGGPLEELKTRWGGCPGLEIMEGNLLSQEDCAAAARNAAVIYHVAAGRGEKAYADAFMNSVVTTRNLLEASCRQGWLRRFVNVSSLSVYSNKANPRWRLLDESCPVESQPTRRGDAYSFAKIKQDALLQQYGERFCLPYVIVRPGVIYGPGNEGIHGRVGLATFGLFLHLGGSNKLPLTYVENCAEAVVLAGLRAGVDGEVFNVVDDDLPTSRRFLGLYKRNVRHFRSIYIPHCISYCLCWLWEEYCKWSEGQLPPVYGRATWHVCWKRTGYSNEKIKERLGWRAKVSSAEGLARHFESCRRKASNA
jgi:nucleoside-diphosphate-sugar epimerase